MQTSMPSWIRHDFGPARFGDVRRTERFLRLVDRVARRPGLPVASTFLKAAERQAAYDFLEHDAVGADQVVRAVVESSARKAAALDVAYVVIDGSSVSLADHAGTKDFGSVGRRRLGARGLKVISSLVLDDKGTVVGAGAFRWWARGDAVDKRRYRRLEERESGRWHEVVKEVGDVFADHAPDTRLHFVADREAAASELLRRMADSGHEFTVRALFNRNVVENGRVRSLRSALHASPALGKLEVALPRSGDRAARMSVVEVRAKRLTLVLRDRHTHRRSELEVTAVWAAEKRRPDGLSWLLLTTSKVTTLTEAVNSIRIYRRRWRIEEFHRTWKKGAYDVEKTQLRSSQAFVKWAMIGAVVAARAERLKDLSRTQPDASATLEFSDVELRVLRALKKQQRSSVEKLPKNVPTLETATTWVAEIGGYIRRKNSRPGSTSIVRGLETLAIAVMVAEAMTTSRAKKR